MLTNFKWLFLVYGVATLLGVGVTALVYPLLGLPLSPGIGVFCGIMLAFFVLRLFQTAHEDDVTVRCGLFGHSMLNVRLEGGGYDSAGNKNPAMRVYACKRCGGEVTVEKV